MLTLLTTAVIKTTLTTSAIVRKTIIPTTTKTIHNYNKQNNNMYNKTNQKQLQIQQMKVKLIIERSWITWILSFYCNTSTTWENNGNDNK